MGVKVREKDKAWWVFIDYHGRRRAKRVCGFGTNKTKAKQAADLVAKKIEVKLAEGDLSIFDVHAKRVTFGEYADDWLKNYAAKNLKASTLRFYEMNLRLFIKPVIGGNDITSIRRSDCKTVVAACRDRQLVRSPTKSPRSKTVVGVARTLSAVLSHAVEDELLPANPAFRMGRHVRRRDEPKAEIVPLTKGEVRLLLDTAKEHFAREYAMLLCAARTGMRLGELCGLEWGDIDFEGRFIEVRRNRTGGEVTTPKNGSTRRVDMSKMLVEELKALLVRRKQEKLKNGWKDLPATVFLSPDGGAVDGDNFRHRVFVKVLTKAGLRHVRFHDLRHTFASLLLQDGQSLAYVRDQLGHSSIQVTADIYGHLVPGANRSAVDRLDEDPPADESATPAQPAAVEPQNAEPVSA